MDKRHFIFDIDGTLIKGYHKGASGASFGD